ncbi:hypothetical protein ACS0TY_026815 [Phlomoides rotata]
MVQAMKHDVLIVCRRSLGASLPRMGRQRCTCFLSSHLRLDYSEVCPLKAVMGCRDLNPLHDVTNQQDYKKKYYKHLIPLGLKYAELLPWGGKITTESMKFFSPIVIWTKFPSSYEKHHLLYSAFKEYLKSWLELMDQASGETDVSQVMVNIEAQHRYLTWRAEKDPGHQVLRRVAGETLAKELVRSFLFNGVDELGNKTFIDYFPEYECDDGTINQKRSMIGKSFESRPWNTRGEFIGNILR